MEGCPKGFDAGAPNGDAAGAPNGVDAGVDPKVFPKVVGVDPPQL